MPDTQPSRIQDGDMTESRAREMIELMFFAYRDFTGEPDSLLARYGFGRAHHRVIYFVGRNAGITVTDLLGILQITKQSLSRVLGHLLNEGFVEQRTDAQDRRRRRLYLTDRAVALERERTARQSARIARALDHAGPEARAGFIAVLRGMIEPRDRDRVPPAS